MACKGDSELRLVLLGCAGAGKSSTANVILGTEDFRETETTKCEMSSRIVEGRNISVIDTPGMNNTSLTEEQWRTEIQRCAELSHPGPHAFLLVIRLWNFTKDRKAVQWIQEHFGEEALKFTVILFTGREELSETQWRKFSQDAQTLDFIKNFKGHYFAMNSKREVNPYQIKKLLEKVETVVQDNGGLYYPQEMFKVQNKNIMKETQEEETQKSWQEEDQDSKKQTLERKSTAEDQTKENQETSIEKEEPQWNTAGEIQTWLASGTSGGENRASSYESDNESLDRYDMMKLENKIEENKPLWRLEEQKKELESIQFDLRQILENIKEQEERGATGGRLDSVSDLRIMLLGGTEVGKSSSGNTILGREAFGKECFTDTIDAWRHDGVLENKTITVVDTGHLFDLMCECVNDEVAPWLSDLLDQFFALCNPGPHVFLAVVKTPNDSIDMISSINRVFGSEFLKRTLILITHGDKCGTDTLEKTPDLQKFIDVYKVGCHVFNNKEKKDKTQVTKLLEKIQVLVQKNEGRCYTAEMYRNRKIEVLVQNNEDLRVVLLGKTGSGKSSTGNTILGREAFKEESSPESVTRQCMEGKSRVDGRNISVVDTPGLFDTSRNNDDLKDEVAKCVEMSVPGPYAFLLIIRLGVKFTDEEKNTVKWIQENFGEDAEDYTIVVFTYADGLDGTLDQYIKKCRHLEELVQSCGGRYLTFNNKDRQNGSQVSELLRRISLLGSSFYTSEKFKAAQKRLQEERERQRKDEERRKKEWEETIREDERNRMGSSRTLLAPSRFMNHIRETAEEMMGYVMGPITYTLITEVTAVGLRTVRARPLLFMLTIVCVMMLAGIPGRTVSLILHRIRRTMRL